MSKRKDRQECKSVGKIQKFNDISENGSTDSTSRNPSPELSAKKPDGKIIFELSPMQTKGKEALIQNLENVTEPKKEKTIILDPEQRL